MLILFGEIIFYTVIPTQHYRRSFQFDSTFFFYFPPPLFPPPIFFNVFTLKKTLVMTTLIQSSYLIVAVAVTMEESIESKSLIVIGTIALLNYKNVSIF